MTAAVRITRLEHTPAALRRAAAHCSDATQARRLLAIALVLEAVSRQAAARQTGMQRQTLRDWVHRYNASGFSGLQSDKPDARPPKLSQLQMATLREMVVAGPDPALHQVIRWRCVDLCDEVARRFEVKVPARTMGKWLRKLDFTRLQPPPYHPKTDAAAQAAVNKTSLPG